MYVSAVLLMDPALDCLMTVGLCLFTLLDLSLAKHDVVECVVKSILAFICGENEEILVLVQWLSERPTRLNNKTL